MLLRGYRASGPDTAVIKVFMKFMSVDFLNPQSEKEDVATQYDNDAMAQYRDGAQEALPIRGGNTLLLSIVRWLVYIVVALTPIFVLPFTSEALEFNKQALIFIGASSAMLLYLIDMVKEGRLFFRKSMLWYALGSIVLAAALTTVFSNQSYRSLFGALGSNNFSLISILGYAMIAFLILAVFERRQASLLTYAMLAGGSIAMLAGLLHLADLKIFGFWQFADSRVFNTLGSANALGIFSAVLLTLGLNTFYRIRGRRANEVGVWQSRLKRVLEISTILLSLLWLAILNWWVLWIVALTGAFATLGLQALKTGYRLRYYFIPMLVIVLGVFLMLTKVNFPGKSQLPAEVSLSHRASWQIAKNVLKEDVIFGSGPENFAISYTKYKPASINASAFWAVIFNDANSEFLSALTTTGAVGAIALIGFFGSILYFLIRYMHKNMNVLRSRGINNFGLDLLPVFLSLLVAFFLYPFSVTLTFLLFVIFGLIAVLLSTKQDRLTVGLENSPVLSLISSVSSVGILIGLAFGFYFGIQRYAANVYFAQAARASGDAQLAQDADAITGKLTKAINADQREDIYAYAFANHLLNRINSDLSALRSLNARDPGQQARVQETQQRIQNFITAALDISKRSTDINPSNAQNWFQRGTVYQNLIGLVGGADDWAVTSFEEYVRRSPLDPQGYHNIGNVLVRKANNINALVVASNNLSVERRREAEQQFNEALKRAEQAYKKALEIKADFAQTIYNLGVVYDMQGRVAEAVRQLELIRQQNPFDAGLALQLGLLYYRNNQKQPAFDELQRAVRIFPDYSNARWYLALMLEERGELTKALEHLRRVLELNPGHRLVLDKIAQLEQGIREIPPAEVTDKEPLTL